VPRAIAGWNHNSHYHRTLLKQVPVGCLRALDVGCGQGEFARRLASRAARVDAIDLDEGVIRHARGQSAALPNVSFIVGDFLTYPVDAEAYDFVAALASLHHMPFEPALTKMARAVRPGGVLVVLGVWPPRTWRDRIMSGAAVVANRWYQLVFGPDRMTAPTTIPTMRLDEVRTRTGDLLPGARVRRRLLWRYTIVWTRPRSLHDQGGVAELVPEVAPVDRLGVGATQESLVDERAQQLEMAGLRLVEPGEQTMDRPRRPSR
jgi:SAM-dependent methyltransferase